MITDYHAKLYAHELRRRHSVSEKLAGALLDAQVDLNPHQVEAALFAFKSPLAKGAILADEVGLGKTIEAGLVLAQKWTEGKRRILINCPANLRKQWTQEMAEKFFLPSTILESATYNRAAGALASDSARLRRAEPARHGACREVPDASAVEPAERRLRARRRRNRYVDAG